MAGFRVVHVYNPYHCRWIIIDTGYLFQDNLLQIHGCNFLENFASTPWWYWDGEKIYSARTHGNWPLWWRWITVTTCIVCVDAWFPFITSVSDAWENHLAFQFSLVFKTRVAGLVEMPSRWHLSRGLLISFNYSVMQVLSFLQSPNQHPKSLSESCWFWSELLKYAPFGSIWGGIRTDM